MSFSYDVSVRVNQTLSTVASSLYQLGFCTAASSTVTPPTLQIAVAGSGTANTSAVQAKCYTIASTAVGATVVPGFPFGTNATSVYAYLKENSGNPGAEVIIADEGSAEHIMTIKSGGVAFFPPTIVGYYATCTSVSSTASLQVIIVGE